MLRPIGTVFTTELPPSPTGTESRWTRTKWKVVKHVDVEAGGGTSKRAVEIKPLNIEMFAGPDTFVIKDGVIHTGC